MKTTTTRKLAITLAGVLAFITLPAHAQDVNSAITSDQLAVIKDFLTAKPGEVVKLRFDSRGGYNSLAADGTITSYVHNKGKDHADVVVPPELTEWFRRIASSPAHERSPKFVYAIVNVKQPLGSSNHPFFNLIGREIRTTTKGKQMIW